MGKTVYTEEAAFLKAWNEGQTRTALAVFGRSPDPGAFYEAAHFVAGAMLSHGFRLFRNGGLPLLERRVESLIQEIIIQPGPKSIRGVYVPLTFKVHLSHEGMKAVRERYWTVASRAPLVVASGHLGLVDQPPGWVIWDVAGGGRCLEDLALWATSLATTWFDYFDSIDELRDDVLQTHVPLLNSADALELVLAERGRDQAKRFLREIIEFGADLSPKATPLRRVDEQASLRSRLDAIATCYRLR
jgi:hypothetical protein